MSDLSEVQIKMNTIPATLANGARYIAPAFIKTTHEFNMEGAGIHFRGRVKDIEMTFIDIAKLKLK